MNKQKMTAAAALLLAARKHEIMLTHLPQDCLPLDAAEAYAVQDAVSQALGAVGGWKVGAKGPAAPASCAPMPAQLIFAAPHHFADLRVAGERGIELEIAVRMQHDLPSRATPYTQADVLAAVKTAVPTDVPPRLTSAPPAVVAPVPPLAIGTGRVTLRVCALTTFVPSQ